MKIINTGYKHEPEVFAVTILIFNEEGQILTVSRKNDDADVNLPGGKVDGNETLREAIERETREETGFILGGRTIEEVFRDTDDDDHCCVTFIYRGNINKNWVTEGKPEGEGLVKWRSFDAIYSNESTYRNYNLGLKKFLVDKGVI